MNTTDTTDGEWVGFTSNSAAIDWGNNALNGQPLTLRDRPGAFWNEKGTMVCDARSRLVTLADTVVAQLHPLHPW